MFKRVVIWRNRVGIVSSSLLAETMRDVLPSLLLKTNGSKYKWKKGDLIVNWGNGKEGIASYPEEFMLNSPKNVSIALNKIKTFQALEDGNVPTLKWTIKKEVARSWYEDGLEVVGRKLIKGSGGRGIELYNKEDENFDVCPLYTLYKKKKYEYRVHVFNDEVIDITQKKKRKGVSTNTKIRNLEGGWVFARENLYISDDKSLKQIGIEAIKSCGLHFGAVDVIWNELENKYYVVEVNSAPGLQGTTLCLYKEALLKEVLI